MSKHDMAPSGRSLSTFKKPVVVVDIDYLDPSCKCGGGKLLGQVGVTSMYENHKNIDCITHPKKSPRPYLLPSYFNIIKNLWSVVDFRLDSYETKMLNLIDWWKKSLDVLSDNPCAGTHVFMHYATCISAQLFLHPRWNTTRERIKDNITQILVQMEQRLKDMRCHLESIKTCNFLLSLIKDPWGHNHLPKLLFGDASPEEVSNFIQFESTSIFLLRVTTLFDSKCEGQALKLSSLALNLCDKNFKSSYHSVQKDLFCIEKLHYECLLRLNKKEELTTKFKNLNPKNNGVRLLSYYYDTICGFLRLPKHLRPKNFKDTVAIGELLSTILASTSLSIGSYFDNTPIVLKYWSQIMVALMESDLKLNLDYGLRIKTMVRTFLKVTKTASLFYMLGDILYCEFGSILPLSLYIEIYIYALSTNINEKERCKHLNNKDELFESLKQLVHGYLKLANMLENVISVCRECVLTAYSLMPSHDLMVRVENLAIKSGKLSKKEISFHENAAIFDNYYSKSVVTKKLNHKSKEPKLTDFVEEDSYELVHSELNQLPDPLPSSMKDNLISVLQYPRFAKFSWNMEWSKIKMFCQQHLDNLDLVLKRNTLLRSDLKFIDLNVDEFNSWTAKKNEQLVNCNNDDNFYDFDDLESLSSVASSGECFSGRSIKRKSSKQKGNSRRLFGARKRKPKKSSRKRAVNSKQSKLPKRNNCQNLLPVRRSLRHQKHFDVTNIGSSLNYETQCTNQNTNSEVEDNNSNSSNDTNFVENNDNHISDNVVILTQATCQTPKLQPKVTRQTSKLQPKVSRQRRTIAKNQHDDFDYSWCPKKKLKSGENISNNNSLISNDPENNGLNSFDRLSNSKITKSKFNNLNVVNNKNVDILHSNNERLNMLSERIPQLSSLDFIMPANTNHIVNVVQIHSTSNTLTNVSQTQTEHVSSHHSSNDIEKKTNDNQTNSNSLDNFTSVYQPNSLSGSTSSIQNSSILHGECSFTGSVSVSNQRITTDSASSICNVDQQEISKPTGTRDVLLDQNQTSSEQQRWNDVRLQNSSERLQSSIENAIHLSSNVIVRTSDVINPSQVTLSTGQTTCATKKPYCVKTRDRFIDLSLPASISSTSTNSSRSSNISAVNSKIQHISPVQTSVGLQVNFNNHQSGGIQNVMSPSNIQPLQVPTSTADNSSSTNIPVSKNQIINSNNKNINVAIVSTTNPVLSAQTCSIGLRLSSDNSKCNASMSLISDSSQSQVIKSNVPNSLYTFSQNQRVHLTDSSHISQTNRSEEQQKIDNLKLISQTFTATSEAIKFVTSNTESQRLIQSTEKNSTSNISIFQNASENVSNIHQNNDLGSKSPLNRGRGHMRTYESKTRALKQANMSDMFVFEKGTLYAVQDDIVSQVEPTKSVSRNNTITSVKIQNRPVKELLEKQRPSPSASPNITITGSMLPRFQQVFGKSKFQSSTVINDTPTLTSTSVASTSLNPGPALNRTNLSTSRVYSSSKGVQTNNDVDSVSSNNLLPKIVENKLQQNISLTKATNVLAVGNNKNNVIMTCKTVSSLKSVPQVTASSSHQLLTSNIDGNIIKKEVSGTPISKAPVTYATSCSNSSIASTSSNVIYTIPVLSDSKATNNIEKSLQGVTNIQRQLKMSPSIIQTVLRKHPNWQQSNFRPGKQSTEVQTSSTNERLAPTNITNIVKTTLESSNNKISVSNTKPNVTEPNVSSSMMEQVREFESVLEEVRKTSLMNEMSTASMLPQINHEIIQIHSPTENVDLLNTDSNQTLFHLNKKPNTTNERDRCTFSFLNQSLSNNLTNEEKEPVGVSSSIISVRSITPTPAITSPNNNVAINPVDGSTQCSKQILNKAKPVIKTPASSPSTSAVKVPVLQKPLPKLQEDEQTTQRIYAILDKYAEQLRNSPELKNKPAPRRRTNPPTNPSLNAKRKKSNQLNLKTCSQQTSCSSSGLEMSPTSDMQAIDSEDSSNAVSHFSHIINSPSRNSEELISTVVSETPSIENTLINVNDVIKKLNVDAEIKSKVSQSTQIVVSGTSGSFLSIPEGSTGNVRLLVAAGKNQKMYRLCSPVTGQGPVLLHQITTKDSCSNDVKVSSTILGQNINDSTILSALTSDDIQIANTSLGNEILLNTSQNSSAFEHKINKSDIILESMEKAQVLESNEKQLSFPVMKKSQASQSTFSVIHTLPCKSKQESSDDIEMLCEIQSNISENSKQNYCNNEQKLSTLKQDLNNKSTMGQTVLQQDKLNKMLKEQSTFICPKSSENTNIISYENLQFSSFQCHVDTPKSSRDVPNINEMCHQQSIASLSEKQNKNTIQISVDCGNKISNNLNNLHSNNDNDEVQKEPLKNNTVNASTTIDVSSAHNKEEKHKPNIGYNEVAAVSAAEIISTANHTSNTFKQKEELSTKNVKTDCELENENALSNTVYNMLDNQSTTSINSKIELLTLRLKNDQTAQNWNNCLSKLMPPGTEKMLEGENLRQLQESFQHTIIKTFKDLKMFVFEQCKQFDNNVKTPKEYDLYDDIDGLGVDKPSTNELFPEVAILNDLDKSVSPTLGLLQASTSRSSDTLQAKRKSVLSHTTSTSTASSTNIEHTTNVVYKKIKTKVSFLKQALYNEMSQDSNDGETKPFVNGSTKTVLESIEQHIDSSPGSPSNNTAVDSETCMSEDSTSTISSGTPHYNFRKSKRKNIEEDGFIESQVIKRMYRGRTSESEEKSEPPKLNNPKLQTTEQKQIADKKESNNRRISNRLKNNNVRNHQHTSIKSPPTDKNTTVRASLRRVSRKTT